MTFYNDDQRSRPGKEGHTIIGSINCKLGNPV